MMLVEALCQRYATEYAAGKKSAAGDRWLIERHIVPELTGRTVSGLTYRDVWKLHNRLKRTPYLANRVLSVLSSMMTLAERYEERPAGSNPCSAVKRYPELKRTRYLTDEELTRLINALEAKFDRKPLEVGLLLLLLYTGARCGEMKAAEWSQVNGTELYLPDSKTGQCVVYFTPQALAVMARLPRARRWIIGPDVNPRYTWASVLDDASIKNLRIHDLRHCFASLGISANLPLPKIGGLLRHSSPKTTQGYAHLVPSEGRAAALAIGERFEKLNV